MKFLTALFLCGAIPVCYAGGIGAPVTGYTFDAAAKAVRAIVGVPGAAVLSAPLQLPSSLSAAWVSPRQDYLLAVDDSGTLRLLLPTKTGFGRGPAVEGAGVPESVTFSPRGSAAVLLQRGVLQVVAGLPESPRIVFEYSAVPEAPAAVSDDGRAVALLGASAWLLRDGASAIAIDVPTVSAAAFRPGSGDLLLASDEAGLLLLREDGTRNVIASAAPVRHAVAAAVDSGRALLAGDDGLLAAVPLDGGQAALASCGCRPTGLSQVSAGPVFRLAEPSGGPVLLFDASTSRPRVWFVPVEDPARSQQ